jgi:hypothetical protein
LNRRWRRRGRAIFFARQSSRAQKGKQHDKGEGVPGHRQEHTAETNGHHPQSYSQEANERTCPSGPMCVIGAQSEKTPLKWGYLSWCVTWYSSIRDMEAAKHHRRVPPVKAGAFEECLPLKRANCGKRHMGSLIRSVPFNFR